MPGSNTGATLAVSDEFERFLRNGLFPRLAVFEDILGFAFGHILAPVVSAVWPTCGRQEA